MSSRLTMTDLRVELAELRGRVEEQRALYPGSAEVAQLTSEMRAIIEQYNNPDTRIDPQAVQALRERVDEFQGKLESLEAKVNELDKRVTEDHETLEGVKESVAAHDERLDRLESLTKQGFDLDLAASMAGYNESEVRKILGIAEDTELTGNELIGAIAKRLALLSNANVEAHQRITKVDEKVDNLDTYVKSEVQGVHTRVDDEIKKVNTRVDEHASTIVEIQNNPPADSASPVPLVIGIFAGVVAFVLAGIFADWGFGWTLVFGLAIACLVAGILCFATFRKVQPESEEKTKHQASAESHKESKEPPKSTSTTTAVPARPAGSDNPPSGSSESPGARTSKTTTVVKETHREPANASS